MSGELNSKRDLARYFTLSGIVVRPEATETLLQNLIKIPYSDAKQRYVDRFVATFKEYVVLNTKSAAAAKATGTNTSSTILDEKIAEMIINSKGMTEFDPQV